MTAVTRSELGIGQGNHLNVRVTPEALAGYDAFNATRRTYDLQRGLGARFTAWAERSPDAVAISEGDRSVSYGRLANVVAQGARRLRGVGVGAGDIVAVQAPRGADFIACLLAIWRVGAIYLPIDPSLPAVRREALVAAARPDALVWSGEGPRPQVTRLVLLGEIVDTRGEPFGDGRLEEDDWQDAPHRAAYIIFTSGSTGSPKGAVIHHEALLNHLMAKIEDFAIDTWTVTAQNAPLSFDISVWQMVASLLCGGRVAVVSDPDATQPHALLSGLGEASVTLLELVPSMLRVVLDTVERSSADLAAPLRALGSIAVGGEEVLPSLVEDWFTLCPGVPLLNVYGPTECADDVSHHRFDAPAAAGVTRLPIGRPIANTQLWLLASDDDGGDRLAGPGERGEICVTGTGVGLGYLQDKARTDAAFYANPFGPGNLYRTGDLGVVEDGVLTYLGRLDRQVKIRGHRVELSEIEAVLSSHPQVSRCAVVVQTRPGRRRAVAREELGSRTGHDSTLLVAHVASNTMPRPTALRDWLTARLPAAMVPHLFMVGDYLSLTPNGKVDLAALPEPSLTRAAVSAQYAAPVGSTEEALATIWADNLKVTGIGRDDDFLELGGDSLRAMLVVNAINETFSARLRARDLLRERSVARTAAYLDASAGSAVPVGSIHAVASSAAAPSSECRHGLTVQQRGLWFHWLLAPENPYYNYQGSWTLRGDLDVAALGEAWQAVLLRHPALLTRFGEDDGEPFTTYPSHETPRFGLVDVRQEPSSDEAFRRLAVKRVQAPIDLTEDCLLRVDLVRTDDQCHELLLTAHEILLDGWAAAVMSEELAEAYALARAGDDLHAFVDAGHVRGRDDFSAFLDWETEHLDREAMADQAHHWRSELRSPLSVLDLPLDRPRSAVPTFRGESVEVRVSSDRVAALEALGRGSGTTLFTTMLCTYAMVLARWSGDEDVVVGIPVANRFDRGVERTVGFLINMLPIRVRAQREASFATVLDCVATAVSEGLSACDYPFAWMLQDTRVERTEASSPVFQTMFNMLNYPHPPTVRDGLSFAFTELETGYTKYDLSLYAQPAVDGGLYLQISYHVDLFDRTTIRRLLTDLDEALDRAVEDPSSAVGSVVPDPSISAHHESHRRTGA